MVSFAIKHGPVVAIRDEGSRMGYWVLKVLEMRLESNVAHGVVVYLMGRDGEVENIRRNSVFGSMWSVDEW